MKTFAQKRELELLSIIIPIYNEANTLELCVLNLRKVLLLNRIPHEILLIESNSSDNSRVIVKQLVREFEFSAYFQDSPRGKGNAVRLGLDKARGEIVAIYDADLEYDPNDLVKLLEPLTSGKSSFVLGTRHKKGQTIRNLDGQLYTSILMNIGHKFFAMLFNLLFNTKLSDPFTMYKVFRKNIFDNVIMKADGFDFDLELVAKARILGVDFIEIFVNYKSRNYAEGKKVNLLTDPVTWIFIMIHCRFQQSKWNKNIS